MAGEPGTNIDRAINLMSIKNEPDAKYETVTIKLNTRERKNHNRLINWYAYTTLKTIYANPGIQRGEIYNNTSQKEILDNLVCEGFVREEPGVGKSSICLHITDKGIEVLIHMHEIVKMSAILSKKDDGEGNLPDSE